MDYNDYNFEESCLAKKQISGDLLKGISEGRIKLGDATVEKLERIQLGSYAAMSIDSILALAGDHGIDSELRDWGEKTRLKISLRNRLEVSRENEILLKEKMLEASREFSKENEGKKFIYKQGFKVE